MHPGGCGLAPSGSPYGGEPPEVRRPIRTLGAGTTLSAYLPWKPVTRGGRTPLVSCWRCRASDELVNDVRAFGELSVQRVELPKNEKRN